MVFAEEGDRKYAVLAGAQGRVVIDEAIEDKIKLTEKIFNLIHPTEQLIPEQILKLYYKLRESGLGCKLSLEQLKCWKLACIVDEEERVQAVLQAIRQNRPASTKATLLFSRGSQRQSVEHALEQQVRGLVKDKPIKIREPEPNLEDHSEQRDSNRDGGEGVGL